MTDWTRTRNYLTNEIERLTARLGDSSDELRSASFLQAIAQRRNELARLDAERTDVEERDALDSDCPCLGVGGYGQLVCVTNGVPEFTTYCWCDFGQQLKAKADQSAAESDRLRDERDREEEEQAQRDRNTRAIERAGIDNLYRAATLKNYLGTLRERNALSPKLERILVRIGTAYHEKQPLRSDFIYGEAGHGKTWLSVALLKAWINRGRAGMFIRCSALTDALKKGMRDGSADALMERLEEIELLVLDDFAMLIGSAYERSKIINLLVTRHASGKLTLINSNYSMEEAARRLVGDDQVGTEEARLLGRLREMCDPLELKTVDLRTGTREEAEKRAKLDQNALDF